MDSGGVVDSSWSSVTVLVVDSGILLLVVYTGSVVRTGFVVCSISVVGCRWVVGMIVVVDSLSVVGCGLVVGTSVVDSTATVVTGEHGTVTSSQHCTRIM